VPTERKIGLLGAGAVGCWLGAVLAAQGVDVVDVLRAARVRTARLGPLPATLFPRVLRAEAAASGSPRLDADTLWRELHRAG
jgi:hypothetical protein